MRIRPSFRVDFSKHPSMRGDRAVTERALDTPRRPLAAGGRRSGRSGGHLSVLHALALAREAGHSAASHEESSVRWNIRHPDIFKRTCLRLNRIEIS
jgi:hypothetical protein